MRDAGLLVGIRPEGGDVRLAADALPVNDVVERVRPAGLELAGVGPQVLPPGAPHGAEGRAIDVQGRLLFRLDGEQVIRTVADDGSAFFHVRVGELRNVKLGRPDRKACNDGDERCEMDTHQESLSQLSSRRD